jgi:hypothetical protein
MISGWTNMYGSRWWNSENRWLGQVKSSSVNRYLPGWTHGWPGRMRLSAEIREKSTETMDKAEHKAQTKESSAASSPLLTGNRWISTGWTGCLEIGWASVLAVDSTQDWEIWESISIESVEIVWSSVPSTENTIIFDIKWWDSTFCIGKWIFCDLHCYLKRTHRSPTSEKNDLWEARKFDSQIQIETSSWFWLDTIQKTEKVQKTDSMTVLLGLLT